jgi:Flp pilus assembly pilin Flp
MSKCWVACVSLIRVYNEARRSYSETGGGQSNGISQHIDPSLRTFVHANQHHDLIEYALMAGFVVAATLAVMPGLSESISTSFGKGASLVTSQHRVIIIDSDLLTVKADSGLRRNR